MTFRHYVIFLILCTLAAWGVWFWVLTGVSVDAFGLVAVALFYGSIGLAVLGSLSLMGLLLRISVLKSEDLRFTVVKVSFRQSLLLTLLFLTTLSFLHLHYLTWWNFLVLVLFVMSLELFFSSSQK